MLNTLKTWWILSSFNNLIVLIFIWTIFNSLCVKTSYTSHSLKSKTFTFTFNFIYSNKTLKLETAERKLKKKTSFKKILT